MTLAISRVAEKLAKKHGLELTATDEHVEARFIGSGATFTGGSAQAAIDQALLSLTEGGSAQTNGRRATEPTAEMPEDAAEDAAEDEKETVHSTGTLVPIEQADTPGVDEPKEVRKAKVKKPPRRKKEKKVKKPRRAKREREEGEEDEEAEDTASVVKAKYRKLYKPTKNTCGDAFTEAFETATRNEDGTTDVEKLHRIGSANGIDVKARWGGRNVGMQRMNLSNVLRGMVRNGKKVKIGKEVISPE